MPRRLVSLVLSLLLALSGTAALAQSEADVERAAAELEAATAGVAAADADHAAAGDRLFAAILSYETTTRDLETAAFRLAQAETSILEGEDRLRRLRNRVDSIAAALYMMGPDLGGFLESTEATVAALAVESAIADIEEEMTVIDGLREDLESARADADGLRASLSGWREAQAATITDIDELLDDIEDRQDDAASRRETAEAAYEDAVAELEKARAGITPKVEAWGDLVAQYFPEDQYWNALRVMACESRGTPTALNPTSDAAGLFQFLPGTWLIASKGAGFEGADPYDPEANIASASWLVQRSIEWSHPGGAWGHWACRRVLEE